MQSLSGKTACSFNTCVANQLDIGNLGYRLGKQLSSNKEGNNLGFRCVT